MAQTLPLNPDGATNAEVEPKVRKFETSNFSERRRVGFNNTLEVVEVSWSPKYKAYWKTLEDFFVAHGGADYFLWQRPGQTVAHRYVAVDWALNFANGQSDTIVSLSATFQEVLE